MMTRCPFKAAAAAYGRGCKLRGVITDCLTTQQPAWWDAAS